MRKIRGIKKGFSFVEIMVALVVLIFGLYGILDLFYSSDTARINSQLKQQASLLGSEKVETIKSAGFDAVSAYINEKSSGSNPSEIFYPETFNLADNNPRLKWRAAFSKSDNPDIINVVVTVLWNIKEKGEVEAPKSQIINFKAVIIK